MKNLALFVVIVMAAVFLAACGAGNDGAAQNAQGANAQESGRILLYTSKPDEDTAILLGGFQKVHPGIQVEVFRSGTEEVISKLYAEKEGGGILADVLLLADNVTFERLKRDNLLMAYDSPEASGIDSVYTDPDHMYYGTVAISSVIAYNTKLAPTPPTDWADMLSPQAAGKISMASPLYSGAAAYQLGVLVRLPRFGWPYYDGLKAAGAKVGRGNGGVITDVVNGEKAYGLVIDYMANNAKKQGNPIDFVYPASGSAVITEPAGIIKSTKNPEAAKRLLDFILSKEGQILQSSIGYVPLRKDVSAPEGLQNISRIQALAADVSALYEQREADKTRFTGIFQ
ncbi:MAG: ABC transporter substrate-binding protein [Spirochaetales bacterium]|jgi:iron(III) transport system substrate-binding protein|nr:ABC transporter substrate-binding protein [Spirochaetales bacterium]